MEFSFLGRMPAGGTFYQVQDGQAWAGWNCYNDYTLTLSMTGHARSRTFHWTCISRLSWVHDGVVVVLPVDPLDLRDLVDDVVDPLGLGLGDVVGEPTFKLTGTCRTIGRPGRFTLEAIMKGTSHSTNGLGEDYKLTFKGAYLATVRS